MRDRLQAALDDPKAAGTTYDGYFGPTTMMAETADGFYSCDLVLHGWDIARATGLTSYEPIAEDEAAHVERAMRELPEEALRSPEFFGPEIQVGDEADPQTRLLAFLGREA